MKIFSTLSGRNEEFSPSGDTVRIYVCGVTPYDNAHLGHAMSYIIFDVVRRYLKFRGYKVKYVQNVTDIDDKIIDRANRLGIPARDLAEKFTDSFFADMAALNITRDPTDVYPRATQEVPKIIEIVQGLVDKGYAYAAHGSVYFRVRNVADYGKLSHRTLDSMTAGIRVEIGEEKEHPMDFVLWKASKPGEPSWESPWGPGRPGWHIECSGMSLRYLGDSLDIHGGGQDLIFPHHENEIAQSESFTGVKPFVKYWMHNGLVQLGEEKMSKSLGNLVTIKQALEKYSADAIRIFVLSSHYRSPLTYSTEALDAAERGADRLRQTIGSEDKPGTDGKIDTGAYEKRFIEAMDDDFNTPQAVAALFDLARDINRFRGEGHNVEQAKQALSELTGILGLKLKLFEELPFEAELNAEVTELHKQGNFGEIPKRIKSSLPQLDKSQDVRTNLLRSLKASQGDRSQSLITLESENNLNLYKESADSLRNKLDAAVPDYNGILDDLRSLDASASASTVSFIKFREQLRQAKQFQLADRIRAGLVDLGVVLEDSPKGTTWKIKQ